MKKVRIKRFLIIIAIVLVIIVLPSLVIFNSASVKRYIKGIKSNYTGGVDRIITVYSNDGKVITTYEGKIDITNGSVEGETEILINDKRISVIGGIVVIEEK